MIIKNIKDCLENMRTIAEWHHEEWAKYNPGQTLEDRIKLYDNFLEENFLPTMLVGIVKDEVVGTACVLDHDMDVYKELFPWLASVYVHPNHRGNGYATHLVNEVVAESKNKGYKEMYLYTPDQQSLYSKIGWTIIEDLNYMGEDVSIMKMAF